MKKILFLFLFFHSKTVSAQEGYQPLAPIQSGGTDLVDGTNLSSYLGGIFNLGIAVAAILAVIMIVVAGLEYMTSEAFSSKAAAKNKIQYAVIGLILALGSYLILFTINPAIVSGRLKFDSVGKKGPNIRLAQIDFINEGLVADQKWYQSDSLSELAKQEDSSEFNSVISREVYPDGKNYQPENLVYELVDAFEQKDAGEYVDSNIMDKIKEQKPDIYERAKNIYEARKALGDSYKNPVSKENGDKQVFDNRNNFLNLFRENDIVGLNTILNRNENLVDSNNNFIDSLKSLSNYEYRVNDRMDPAVIEIYDYIRDMQAHTVNPNNPFSAQQKSVYEKLNDVIKDFNSPDFSAPLNPDEDPNEQDEIGNLNDEIFNEGQ